MRYCTESISVRRGGRALLDAVSLQLEPGRVTALLGPNGAGKSTLLKLLAGDLAPDEGVVRLDGTDLGALSAPELAMRRAVLPQLSGLSFPFTVREVVRLGRHPHGDAYGPSGADAVHRALEALELEALAETEYGVLSGGERQRTHAARVLAQLDGLEGQPWLLLDEPTSALDLAHQHRLLEATTRRARSGVGVLLVLHDPNLAARYADDLVLLGAGRVLAHGPTREVLAEEPLSQLYGVPVRVLQLSDHDHPVVVA